MDVEVACPVCKQMFTLRISYTPRVTFGWSGKKGYLGLEVTTSAIEHVCIQAQD